MEKTMTQVRSQIPVIATPIKYCLYARKSMEAEDQQALSIESQVKEMMALAQNEKDRDKKCQVRLDPKRAPIIKQMFEKVGNEQWSGRKVFKWLKGLGFKSRNGKTLVLGNIYQLLRNTFYYGEFEFPVGNGIMRNTYYEKGRYTKNENCSRSLKANYY